MSEQVELKRVQSVIWRVTSVERVRVSYVPVTTQYTYLFNFGHYYEYIMVFNNDDTSIYIFFYPL